LRNEEFDITKTVQEIPRSLRGLPYLEMKRAVLGYNYNLSLVFVANTFSRRLNRSFRNKDKPANILSFPLSKEMGEIFIDLQESKLQARRQDQSLENFVSKLFLHGLLHLKGMQHGYTMEKAEMKFFKKFHLI
jgi:probable rRNA maturation factor